MERVNQCDILMDYLKDHHSITQYEAMSRLGIMRLASRISDLKREGVVIHADRVKVGNRRGRACYVARYILVETGVKDGREE